jgi:hypothetical protein
MSRKTIIIIGMVLGSGLGGYLTTLFVTDDTYLWTLLGSTLGALIGIYISFKAT